MINFLQQQFSLAKPNNAVNWTKCTNLLPFPEGRDLRLVHDYQQRAVSPHWVSYHAPRGFKIGCSVFARKEEGVVGLCWVMASLSCFMTWTFSSQLLESLEAFLSTCISVQIGWIALAEAFVLLHPGSLSRFLGFGGFLFAWFVFLRQRCSVTLWPCELIF